MRADELDVLRPQMPAQTIAVVGPVGDPALDVAPVARRYPVEGVLDERDLRRAGFEELGRR